MTDFKLVKRAIKTITLMDITSPEVEIDTLLNIQQAGRDCMGTGIMPTEAMVIALQYVRFAALANLPRPIDVHRLNEIIQAYKNR